MFGGKVGAYQSVAHYTLAYYYKAKITGPKIFIVQGHDKDAIIDHQYRGPPSHAV
jgi:hypothetical protein